MKIFNSSTLHATIENTHYKNFHFIIIVYYKDR